MTTVPLKIDTQEQVSTCLVQLMLGDIVRFSLGTDCFVYQGQIQEIVDNNDRGVGSITIKHLDNKYRERVLKYECPGCFR